jgi:hypothetical protein
VVDAYVHGIMEGETVRNLGDDNWKSYRFINSISGRTSIVTQGLLDFGLISVVEAFIPVLYLGLILLAETTCLADENNAGDEKRIHGATQPLV